MKPSSSRITASLAMPLYLVRFVTLRVALCVAPCVALAAACDTSHSPGAVVTGTGGSGGTGAGGESTVVAPVGLAILSSDYKTTSLSIYDAGTNTLTLDGCIHSGMTGAAMTQELSGDATLPTEADPVGHEIVVIDRGNATLTFIDPATCVPRKQIAVGGADGNGFGVSGFKANPHDVIGIDGHKAYVTRYETNATPSGNAADLDQGNDLLVIDPGSGQVERRIDLTDQASFPGTGILARPDRGVRAEGNVYVTLGNASLDLTVAAAGRVVVVDPATDTVIGHVELPNQKGCSGIEYVASTHKLYVACATFTDDWQTQVATSALVEIDIAAGAPGTIGRVISASALGMQQLSFSYAAVQDETAYLAQLGSFANPSLGIPDASDAFYAVDLRTGGARRIYGGGKFNLGRVAVVAETGRVYLPDGDPVNPRVHMFVASTGAAPVPAGEFDANPAGGLPPREVFRF